MKRLLFATAMVLLTGCPVQNPQPPVVIERQPPVVIEQPVREHGGIIIEPRIGIGGYDHRPNYRPPNNNHRPNDRPNDHRWRR
jgi:hypothetical protein